MQRYYHQLVLKYQLTMYSTFLVAVIALLVGSNGQPNPECAGPPPRVMPFECCPNSFPRFMTRELAQECGLPAEMADGPPSGPPSGPPPNRMAPPTCDAILCVMRKNNLVTADNKVDKAALKAFAESQYSAEWKPSIDKAIQVCNGEENASDPCPAMRYTMCFKMNMVKNCPASIWVASDDCTAMKTFLEKCARPPQN